MGLERLSSRAVIGEYYLALQQDPGIAWVNDTSMEFDSDQDSETYPWLGQTPGMREWVGGRQAKGFRDNGITVANKHYETTVEILLRWLRRDKTGQAMVRIRELAARTNSHWASLLSTLLLNGPSTVCYDGQYFFDTDHSEGDSGTQSNDITVDISTLPASVHGVITAPSVEEMQQSILAGIVQMLAFKDDQGEPMNETAQRFRVIVPAPLYIVASKAVALPIQNTAITDQRLPREMSVDVSMNARLTWTDSFSVFRADGSVKPFIRQQETPPQMKAKAEGSDFEFDNDAHQYGVDTWRNVAYGFWQHGCYVTMI